MRVSQRIATIVLLMLAIVAGGNLTARTVNDNAAGKAFIGSKAAAPAHCLAAHRVGTMEFAVNNNGTFGTGFRVAPWDFFTGEAVSSCEYPRGSNVDYMFAGTIWVGAVVGRDTLVSVGADGWSNAKELNPDEAPFGNMIKRTAGDPEAVSHEDYVSVYMDTITDGVPPDWTGRPHVPLNIEVTQSSYAWSHPWAEDFVLLNYQIKNIGQEMLTETYMGFYVDADICNDCDNTAGYADDLSGFLQTYPTQSGNCEFLDTINIAWSADNDGDFYAPIPAPHVTGLAPLGVPSNEIQYNFNWWVSNGNSALDFGPRLKPTAEDPFRDFGTGGIGTPEGDQNKYYVMSHPEFDYDQAYTATISQSDTLWLYPTQTIAGDIANGFDTRYLLSVGPFDIAPGQTLPITMAYVAGENLHTNAANIQNLPDNPDAYYANLDFSDLATNARWASWTYDLPGVDTDGDAYFGKFRVCCEGGVCDTMWYEGDGVPDFGTPPGPMGDMVWVEPREEALWVRWNGLKAETTRDPLTGQVDFEGYRIHLSPDGSPGSYAQVESYDIEDYLKYTYSQQWGWELRDYPFRGQDLRCIYGASCDDLDFDPNNYTEANPYVHPSFPESLFYFEPFDLNKSQFGVNTQIRKIYPLQPRPHTLDPDSALPRDLTPDGFFRYFEYMMTINNLLPGECYWVNVTRTDFGAPHFGLPGEESDLIEGHPIGCTPPPEPGFRYDTGWNLVSAPVDLESSLPSDIFGDLPYWQLHGWNGSSYYNPTEMNGCGEGYWLFAPEPAIVDYQGSGCAPALTSYCISTDLGWNAVGSPFVSGAYFMEATFQYGDVVTSWANAVTSGWISREMLEWNGTFYQGSGYVPGGGARWVAAMVEGLEICWYPEPPAPEREPLTDLFAASNEHTMTISLTGTSQSVQIGVDDQATAGFDSKFDMPSPPTAPGARAGLVIESANTGVWSQLKTDVRPLNDELIWSLKLTGSEYGELQFENVASLAQHGYSVSLIDSRGQTLATLDDDRTVKVDPGSYSIVASRTGSNTTQIPSDYVLSANYPNPFNPSTTIEFGLPASGQVRLAVYNLLGQQVALLVDEPRPAGWHEVLWNGRNNEGSAVSSGLYFYRLEAGEFVQSRKMLLIK